MTLAEFLDLTPRDVKLLEEDNQTLTVSKLELLCKLYNMDKGYILEDKAEFEKYELFNQAKFDITTVYQIK